MRVSSADEGVGIHINDVPIFSSRLFETEYYDIEQVQILRGPQGTLQGRNSTGGTVNMLTKKPSEEFEGDIDIEYGDFDHKKVKGALNIPLGDLAGMRLSGIWLQRDGYTENIYTGDPIDGRDQYSVRGALQLRPGDNTTIDLMVSYFEEDSDRTRSQKQMCHNDPSALLGCLPDRLAFENPNPSSQFSNNVASTNILSVLGLFEFGANNTSENPSDLRKVNADYQPVYESDETLLVLELKHSFELYTINAIAAYQETSVLSRQDYLWTVGGFIEPPPFLPLLLPETGTPK